MKRALTGLVTHFCGLNRSSRHQPFSGSKEYWIERYRTGGDSGAGSHNELASFKAEILNRFVTVNRIQTVIEFGCGDGSQLMLAEYPSYLGFDISPEAISRCRQLFVRDSTKVFGLLSEYRGETAELSLSLDVVFHLVEDDVFAEYMNTLFDAARRFAIIYSSNTEDNQLRWAAHVRHRRFSDWIEAQRPEWKLHEFIPNRYPFQVNPAKGSFADFYIYAKQV